MTNLEQGALIRLQVRQWFLQLHFSQHLLMLFLCDSDCMYCCRYYVCVAILIYFLPLLVMGCAYLVVGLTLWASEIPGDSSDRYKEQLTAKRKVMCPLDGRPQLLLNPTLTSIFVHCSPEQDMFTSLSAFFLQ